MKWPWNRELPEPPPATPDDIGEAREARRKATADFMEAVDRNLEVNRVSREFHAHRDAYAAAIEKSMRRRHA